MAQTGRTVIIEIKARAQSAVRSLKDLQKEQKKTEREAKTLTKAFAQSGARASDAFDTTLRNSAQARQAIERTQQSFRNLGEGADRSGREIVQSMNKAIRSVKGLERAIRNTFSGLIKNTGRGVRAVDSMEAAFEDLQRRQRITAEQLETGVISGMNRVNSSALTMRSSLSASANNLGFEMVQAAQDAKFGLAGVANQIPLMTEQLTQLTLKSGSTAGALTALRQAFLGPVGIVAAITLFLTYQDDLIGFFTETEDSAKDADDAFKGFFRTTDSGIPNIQKLQEELDEMAGTIGFVRGATRGLVEQYTPFIKQIALLFPGVRTLVQGFQSLGENTQAAKEAIEELTGLPLTGAEFQQLEERTRRLRAALERTDPAALALRDQLVSMGADVETIVSGSFKEAREEVAKFDDKIQEFIDETSENISLDVLVNSIRRELGRITEEEQFRIDFLAGTEEDLLEAQVDFLEEALIKARELSETPEEFGENFGPLQRLFIQLNAQLQEVQSEAEETTSALQELIEKRNELREELELETGEQGEQLAQARDQIESLEERIQLEKEVNQLLLERQDLTRPEAREQIVVERILEDLPQVEDPGDPFGDREEPPIVRQFSQLIDTLDTLRARLRVMQDEVDLGLITPLDAANQRVRNLTLQAQHLLDAGFDPNSERVQNIVEKLGQARRELVKMELLFGTINQVARSIGEFVGTAIFGSTRRELERLRKQRDRIREQLEDAQAEATVTDPRIAQIRRLRDELENVEGKIHDVSGAFGRLNVAIKQLGDAALNIVRQLVAELTAAIAKAAILSGIQSIVDIGLGGRSFGELFVGALLGAFEEGGFVVEKKMQAGGFVSGPGGPTSDTIPAMLSDGEFVVNSQSAQVAPELLRRINESPGFAKALSQSFTTNNTFASGGFVGSAPSSISQSTSAVADVRIEIVPRALPSGDLAFATREAESHRTRLGYKAG